MSSILASALSLLLLAAAPPKPQKKEAGPPPKKTPAATPAPRAGEDVPLTPMLSAMEPGTPRFGEPVTLRGTSLDKVRAVIVGEYAPAILSQDETTLVFRAPSPKTRAEFQARVFVVAPGFPVTGWKEEVTFARKPRTVTKRSARRASLLDESVRLSRGAPKRFEVDGTSAAEGLELRLHASGGEVEARIESLDPKSEPLYRPTYSGSLRWRLSASALGNEAQMPGRIAITLSTDSPTGVEVQASLTAKGGTD